MAIATTAATASQVRPRLFTVDEYDAMGAAGVFGHEEHVELIEGQIVEMFPRSVGHIWAVSRLIKLFVLCNGVVMTIQSPLLVGVRCQPDPDLVVLRADASREQKPSPPDVLLVIEVADSSLAYDRETKGPLYAVAGISEYWIVDLNGERIEVYREPSAAGYRSMRIVLRGEHLTPAFAPDLTVEVDAVLGPAVPTD